MAFNSIDFGGPKQGRDMGRLARDLLRVGGSISISPVEKQNKDLFSGLTTISSQVKSGGVSGLFGGGKKGLFKNQRMGRLPIGGRIDAI